MNYYKKEQEISQEGFSQSEFLESVRAGGVPLERATQELIAHFKGYPMMFRNRYGLETEEAIDAYTDAIMVVISYIREEKLDERYSLSTYLYRITRNKCIDTLRKRGRGKRLEKAEIPMAAIPTPGKSLVQELILSETFRSMLDVLNRFKGKCKEIIMKWGYWGYSMADIAETLELNSPEAARKQKSRCIKRLRNAVDQTPPFSTFNQD